MKKYLIALMLITNISFAESKDLGKIAAIVNGQIITSNQVESALKLAQKIHPDVPNLRYHVLRELILRSILLQTAQKLKLNLSDEQVREMVNGLAAQQSLSPEEFHQKLKERGAGLIEVKEELIIDELKRKRLINKINVESQEVIDFMASPEGKELLLEQPETVVYQMINEPYEDWMYLNPHVEIYNFVEINLKERKFLSAMALWHNSIYNDALVEIPN